jgi:hypothetical protein
MGMVIDGIGTSEAIDSSGELLELAGLDISDLTSGKGVLNTEHRGDDAPGYSYLDIIGRVIFARKIFKRDDCENDRQRMYWDEVKLPYLYIKCELFDDDADGEHPSAKAAAAMIRHYKNRGLPILIRYSIEGSTLEMKDKTIKAAIARRVASTIKPANKQCNSGILEDHWLPASKKGKKGGIYDGGIGDVLEESGISKFETPDGMVLGKSVVMACDPEFGEVEEFLEKAQGFLALAKALEGGSYNAAPSTLTGGAALQREDLGERHRRLVAVCKAALRDHDPQVHGPFKQYLKNVLPEASDEFLERFAALGDELSVSGKLAYLKKADVEGPVTEPKVEEKPSKPERYHGSRRAGQAVTERGQRETEYGETLARIKEARSTSFPDEDAAGRIPPVETKAFRSVRPRTSLKTGDNQVDPIKGLIYIGGSENNPPRVHKLYAPGADEEHYTKHLTDPGINAIHDKAMENWVLMHRLARQGKLPDEVIAHAGLFSLMSPNESIQIQELAHGFLNDMMAKGWDPRKEYTPEQYEEYEQEFKDMAAGQHIPEYERAHFMSDASGIWRKPNKKEIEQGTYRTGVHTMARLESPEQRIRSTVGKQSDKWGAAARYHEVHGLFAGLIKQHGVNGDAIMDYLAQLKQQKGNYQSRAYTAEKKGQPKPADPRAGEPQVYGFGLKTLRYTLGMLGLGTNIVPDTHFIRHSFGLHPEDPRIGDAKAALDGPQKEPLLKGIDQWYRVNHPSFNYTREKLKAKYGEDFGNNATFPAFWLHWLTIAPHERASKWPTGQASNEGTDHGVYWNAVLDILRRYNLPTDPHHPSLRKFETFKEGGSLPARTAHAMKEIEERFGETAASLAYYTHLVPLLLAPSKPASLYKAELLARLMKGEHSEETAAPKTVMHKGHVIEPGIVEFVNASPGGLSAGHRMPLVSFGKDWHKVLGQDGSLMKLKATHPNIRVISQPRLVRSNTSVDSKKHGVAPLHGTDNQHDIINGIDMARRIEPGIHGATSHRDRANGVGMTGWYQSKEGHLVYVKPADLVEDVIGYIGGPTEFGAAHREAAYSRLADEFFKLGDHVPTTTLFKHPVTDQVMSAQAKVGGSTATHYDGSAEHKGILGFEARRGTLDKLAMMDMILGHSDRNNNGNWFLDSSHPGVHLIDNAFAFSPSSNFVPGSPSYWRYGNIHNDGEKWYKKPMHKSAVDWLKGLNPQTLAKHMDSLGVPKDLRDESVRRLQAVQDRLEYTNASRGAVFFSPFIAPYEEPHRDELDEKNFNPSFQVHGK